MLLYWIIIVPVLGTALWKTNNIAKSLIKYSIFICYCFLTTLLIPLWLFRPRDPRNPLLPSAGFRALCKILELECTIEGEENIVRNSGCVVLINHQSIIDMIVLSYLWPTLPKCTVISKKEMLYYQPIGLAFWLCGVIFIDRNKSSDAQNAINKTGETIKTRKARVLMFPEGTRNLGPKLIPFKKGAFHLAVASQCPIQPIAVSRYTFLGPNKFEAGRIRIRILPAIQTEGCTTKDVDRLKEDIYQIMSENVDELSKSIDPNRTV
ncbi:unnamed protein product [Phyllotreta striolata]|uniref:1-acyl-sn-glycerol-3-phosphate acyltransferase n=1 Tax=Phyllotreta striolata TaxID=444603 RepID=A0A9N9TL85_PHYSR|nr:unnamed protein product [Phyllotreta striolata]